MFHPQSLAAGGFIWCFLYSLRACHEELVAAPCACFGDAEGSRSNLRLLADKRACRLASLDYQDFINGEARYTRLAQQFPERAKELFAKAEATAKAKYERLKKLVEFYNV